MMLNNAIGNEVRQIMPTIQQAAGFAPQQQVTIPTPQVPQTVVAAPPQAMQGVPQHLQRGGMDRGELGPRWHETFNQHPWRR